MKQGNTKKSHSGRVQDSLQNIGGGWSCWLPNGDKRGLDKRITTTQPQSFGHFYHSQGTES